VVAVTTAAVALACWHRQRIVQSRPEGPDEQLAGQPLAPDPSSLSNDELFLVLFASTAVLAVILAALLTAAVLRGATGVRTRPDP
jgi:hypothetical protein